MLKLVRYVFYRLHRQQRKVLKNPVEAKYSAAIFMSIAPISVLVALDIVYTDLIGGISLYDRLGRWGYGLGLFGLVFLMHFWFLVRGDTAAKIDAEFYPRPASERLGTFFVASYLIVPPLAMVVLAAWLQGQ